MVDGLPNPDPTHRLFLGHADCSEEVRVLGWLRFREDPGGTEFCGGSRQAFEDFFVHEVTFPLGILIVPLNTPRPNAPHFPHRRRPRCRSWGRP